MMSVVGKSTCSGFKTGMYISYHGENAVMYIKKRDYFMKDGRISGYSDTKYMRVLRTEPILHYFEDQKSANFFNLEQVNFRVTLVMCALLLFCPWLCQVYQNQIDHSKYTCIPQPPLKRPHSHYNSFYLLNLYSIGVYYLLENFIMDHANCFNKCYTPYKHFIANHLILLIDISSDPVTKEDQERFEANKQDMDRFLGPYPYER